MGDCDLLIRKFVREVVDFAQDEIQQFAEALEAFVGELWDRLPRDGWRDDLDRFIADWAQQGTVAEPEDVEGLKAWIAEHERQVMALQAAQRSRTERLSAEAITTGSFGAAAGGSSLFGSPIELDYAFPSGANYEVCFAAGTQVLTSDGFKPIEAIRVGDMVLAAHESDPEGPLAYETAAEVFHNPPTELASVHFDGGVIRSSLNHPFYVRGKGWTAATELVTGDILRTPNGTRVAIAAVERHGDIEPVFNVLVAERHTYFVGSTTHPVLVHNPSPAKAAPDFAKGTPREGGLGTWKSGRNRDSASGVRGDSWFHPYDKSFIPVRYIKGDPQIPAITYRGRAIEVDIKLSRPPNPLEITANDEDRMRKADIAAAKAALASKKEFRGFKFKKGMTWHHVNATGRMRLVETELHNTMRHIGGYSRHKTNLVLEAQSKIGKARRLKGVAKLSAILVAVFALNEENEAVADIYVELSNSLQASNLSAADYHARRLNGHLFQINPYLSYAFMAQWDQGIKEASTAPGAAARQAAASKRLDDISGAIAASALPDGTPLPSGSLLFKSGIFAIPADGPDLYRFFRWKGGELQNVPDWEMVGKAPPRKQGWLSWFDFFQ